MMSYKTESPDESPIDKARRLLANEEIVVDSGSWRDLILALLNDGRFKSCGCERCRDMMCGWNSLFLGMIVCVKCGNKRCPHATDHRFTCTGSNDPGQPGSRY